MTDVTNGAGPLSAEDRTTVDLVAAILLDLQHEVGSESESPSEIDRLSVGLRKLLLDGGAGHYARAWGLLCLPGQPMVKASDLDATLARSTVDARTLVWVEAPVARPRQEGWSVVTDTSRFIPADFQGAQLITGHDATKSYFYFRVEAADGRAFTWAVVPSTGSVVATRFEPFLASARPRHVVAAERERYLEVTHRLTLQRERSFTLSELRASTAIAAESERLTRQNAIGFLANRRGAHIDPSVHTTFRRDSDADREQQYQCRLVRRLVADCGVGRRGRQHMSTAIVGLTARG